MAKLPNNAPGNKKAFQAKLEKSFALSGRLIRSPGIYGSMSNARMCLDWGRQIRDELVQCYPLLPEAIDICVQMCSTREWVISGQPRMVPRAIEAINNAQTITLDGYTEYGFEQFLKRQARDYFCVGRRMHLWSEFGELTYLDPCFVDYDIVNREWYDTEIAVKYAAEDVVLEHPKPIGRSGNFLSPIFSVIPTAMLAWLIREHDTASIDGRKIRDVIIVGDKGVAEQIATALGDIMALWDGRPKPEQQNIPIVYMDQETSDVSKIVTRLGISEMPNTFDRDAFDFAYANQMATGLGIPLRRIWNSEKATNRALEEVQEQRQDQTGPPVFVRTTQRLLNGRNGLPRRFGKSTRFGFIEAVDSASKGVNADVLQKRAQALQIFANVFGGQVNGDAFLAWLQSEGDLPEDLDLITNIGTMQRSDTTPTPVGGNIQASSDPVPSAMLTKSITPEDAKQFLDYGEITMNGNGKVVERRNRVYSFQTVLEKSLEIDTEFIEMVKEESKPVDFSSALLEARKQNRVKFIEIAKLEKSLDPEMESIMKSEESDLKATHYRKILTFLKEHEKEEIVA